jgi:hypothetical protein
MSATPFTLDDITLAYSEEDYKPQRAQPKIGLTFEFEVIAAKVEQSKQGHLQAALQVSALDSDGKEMFKKYLNVPMPVSIKEIQAPEYAKGMWTMMVGPLFPKLAPYDSVAIDTATGRKVYSKGGKELKGPEFDEAIVTYRKAIAEIAKTTARQWIEEGDASTIEQFMNKRFYAKLRASKDGKYVNIDRMYPTAPDGEEVCYDKKEAMTK